VDEESGFVTRSILCLPLRVRDETIGALEILNKTGGFDQDDLQLMESVTAQAAIAIQNARLYQDEQAARERADTLRETSRVVGSTLELDDVLSLVLRQTKRVLTYDTASILLFAGDEPAMAAVAG
jgi:GAF domain-containing protein